MAGSRATEWHPLDVALYEFWACWVIFLPERFTMCSFAKNLLFTFTSTLFTWKFYIKRWHWENWVFHSNKYRHETITRRAYGGYIGYCVSDETGQVLMFKLNANFSFKFNALFDTVKYEHCRYYEFSFRGGMVQTNEQYEFVHQALSLYERELPDRPPCGD